MLILKLWHKIIHDRFRRSFFPAVTLIILAIALQLFFNWQNNPERIIKKVEKTVSSKESLMKSYMDILERNYNPYSRKTQEIFSSAEMKSMDEAGISVNVYIDDSLAYWSTNTFSAPTRLVPRPGISYPDVRKTNNGWYIIHRRGDYTKVVEGRILIKREYPFENDYLVNTFQKDFKVPAGTEVIEKADKYPVYSPEKAFLFSLKIPPASPLPDRQSAILVVLYLTALLLLVISIYHFLKMLPVSFSNTTFFLIFLGSLVLMRFVQVLLRIPGFLYDTKLFGPESFASSFFFPSLGDFLINSICFLIVTYIFYNTFSAKIKRPEKLSDRMLMMAGITLVFMTEVLTAIYLLRDIVINSTIPFNLQNFSKLNFYSLLGFIIISAIFLSLFLIGLRILGWAAVILGLRNRKWVRRIRMRKFSGTSLVLYLTFFSVFATVTLNHYNDEVEMEKRKLLAIRLAADRDPLAEMIYSKIEPKIISDSLLKLKFEQNPDPDSLLAFLQEKYFRDYWNNFTIQLTNCNDGKVLRVQPQNYLVECNHYFQTLINEIGETTFSRYFYYLDYGYGFKNYLAIIPYGKDGSDTLKAYLEISSKLVFRDRGYPELLIDKRQVQLPDLSGYSYAFFRNGKLVNRVGNYQYSMDIVNKPGAGRKSLFYSGKGYNHYIFHIDNERTLVLSKREDSLFDKISPFSYLFLIFTAFTLLFYMAVSFRMGMGKQWFGLGTRLQLTMSLILVTSLIIIGLLVVYYITSLNNEKNKENLNERAHSILVELQHKLGSSESLGARPNLVLEDLLTKFANVFFSDVNIYDTNGRLVATSRPEIFESGIVSKRMNGEAFRYMRKYQSSYYMTQEKVGLNKYSSAYLPFYNENEKLLAYLNLPYFTRQEELEREISSFLIAFINIYILLIIISLIISLVVSKYITRPLRLLTSNIGRLGFGRKNEMLRWARNDEIGKLVDEYNRMVSELDKSAGLLARSERESAWREMARQVAHEIKNPLTPMKLSVQHLQKAWKDEAPDWEDRLHRFTDTMTEQIETLAAIASEFSDFAKMPVKKEEIIDIQDLIDKIIVLYRDIASIRFVFNMPDKPQYITADRKQLNRVFTNLINNAVYAIGDKTEGLINISVVTERDSVLITIADNGSGISREQADHIFQPNFTTKSGGMGLGLAIVKSIVQGTSGEIHFHSEEGKGTAFMLRFPLKKD